MIVNTLHNNKSKGQQYDWDFIELAEKFKNPIITPETHEEFLSMSKQEQEKVKDVGGILCGKLKKGRRTKDSVINRTALALDADFIENPEEARHILDTLEKSHWSYIVHSTRKSTPQKPRYRIIIPFYRPVSPSQYVAIARKVCQIIGMDYFDPTTVEYNRFMYWPSISRDYEKNYFYDSRIAEPLDTEGFLRAHYNNWENRLEWPRFENENQKIIDESKKQEDPLIKEGVIGAFCRTYYPISDVISTYLSDVYNETDTEGRYTYSEGSTFGGAVIYDDKFLYSHHATDPAGGVLCNAFDLVRIHKFGLSKESEKRMIDFALKDEKVKQQLAEDDFKELDLKNFDGKKEEILEFLNQLERNRAGEIKPTVNNIKLILENDPSLKNFYKDEFAKRPKLSGAVPWNLKNNEVVNWSKQDDSGLRWYLENQYGIYSKQKTDDARNQIFTARTRHPIREYLNSLEWDHIPRLDTLLADYFGASNNCYTQDIMRKALIAAVARVMEPGIKFDNMLILIGSQGIGKSTFLSTLGGPWFTDSIIDFASKEGYQMLKGNWIIEIGELSGFYKKEVEQIKAFLSKQSDEYRAPYSEWPEEHKRQCIIFGTTNSKTFLKDQTGNRRFWPVQLEINKPTKDVFTDLKKERDQIWAEAFWRYENTNEDLFLTGESLKQAKLEQEKRTEEDPRRSEIIDFILQKVPENWLSYNIEDRRAFFDNYELQNQENLKPRDRICFKEIWYELYRRDSTSNQDIKKEYNQLRPVIESIPGLEKKKMKFGKDYSALWGYKVTPEFYEWCNSNA